MFLHSGAAFHGHEYSPPVQKKHLIDVRPRSNLSPRRTPLTRSAYSTPSPPKSTVYENPLPILSPPARPLSYQAQKTSEHSVRFQDLETMSEDSRSVANSEGSEVTSGGKRRRSSTRTSTTFLFAHPAPTLTQKQKLLQIRPKLLLQLQRLSSDSRPMPAVDVLPSTLVVPRLAKKFPRMFKGKGELGSNDVMIVKSEEYNTLHDNVTEGHESDEESLGNRDMMAVICQMPKDLGGAAGKAEIVLSNGSVWIAAPLSNGIYEFISVDDQGHKITARWVKRAQKRGSVDGSAGTPDFKFTFSIINPDSRRHPVLATINQSKMDIPDQYTSVSPSSGYFPPLSPIQRDSTTPAEESREAGAGHTRTLNNIDESTRRLILITGVWVALREGWCPQFRYNDVMTPLASPTSRARSSSLTPDLSRPPSFLGISASTPESSNSPASTLGVLSTKRRRASLKASPMNAEVGAGNHIPKRSISTGTAFMQREKARRSGHPPSTVASESEAEGSILQKDTTERIEQNNLMLNPSPIHLPVSGTTTPETPTRPQKRHSISLNPRGAQNGEPRNRSKRRSLLSLSGRQSGDGAEKEKTSRWKSFTNLFRRTNRTSD